MTREKQADPPEWEDLEDALAHASEVKNLKLGGQKEFPEAVTKFPNLEVLDIYFSDFKSVPASLASLPRLRKLELNFNHGMREIPDEVFAMPSLREVSLYEAALPKKYQMLQINALLGGFAKVDASRETRLLHVALLLADEKRALALGDVKSLIGALDSNVAVVRAFALRMLEKKIGTPKIDLKSGDEIIVAGKLAVERDVLAERLAKRGVKIAKKVGPKTAAIVIGAQPKGKAASLLDQGVTVALEVHLRAALDAGDTPFLVEEAKRGGETADKLGELLGSSDAATVKLALEMMKKGGVPKNVLEELLLVIQNPQGQKKVRDDAKRLFAQYAPRELQDAVTKVLARTSLYLSGEQKVHARLKALAKKSKGGIDPVKLAMLLLKSGRGYSYLFEVGTSDSGVALRALEVLIQEDTLDLSGGELDALPEAISKLPRLRKLKLGMNGLSRNHFREIPAVVVGLADLEELDMSENRLSGVPDAIERMTGLRVLDLSANFIRSFPDAVFRLQNLRSLDLSTSRYGAEREAPLNEIPERIGELKNLEEFIFRAHHLETLPGAMRKLTKLRKLDLFGAKLAHCPAWLAELPLEELQISYIETKDKQSIDAVVKELRARGAKVDWSK